jgi:molecular chaperone DnaK
MGGVMTKLIDANTTIPCKKSEVFSTAADNQTEVTIHVLQGERPMAKDNKSIGRFNLTGILPAKRGVPQIEVTFDIDANGILNVSAKDKATGKEQSIRIEASSGLSDEEIKRMKAEAEANAEADKKAKETADAVNKADTTVFQNEQMIEQFKDKLTEDDKSTIQTKIDALKEAIKNNEVDKFESLEKEITDAWQSFSAKIYSQQNTEKPKTEEPKTETKTENANTDGETIDVDAQEVH